MSTHNEYLELVKKRFAVLAQRSYEDEANYLWLLYAPAQYKVEASMLAYAKQHPDASSAELCNYFDTIAPEGLPPGDDGADLLEDD